MPPKAMPGTGWTAMPTAQRQFQDVYQESDGGKWVRYDENGKMVKGWNTNENGTYYFDPITGAMAHGTVEINGKTCHFDKATGILK